jgi:deoxyribonuclease-4
MPAQGGAFRAVERIRELGGAALQFFTRNQRQWRAPALGAEEAARFAEARALWGAYPIAAHDSYLTNLASPDPELRERSIANFALELERAALLDIPFLITHPGAHMGAGLAAGIKTYAAALDEALGRARIEPSRAPLALLENTAGQGTCLGGALEELAEILDASQLRDRLGICFDSCHAFVAGYDLASEKGLETTLGRFDALLGLDRLRFLHLNDAKHELGSRKDRHEHIGKGRIGEPGFARLLQDPRLRRLPMVIETPKDKALAWDRENLARLRRLAS